MKWQGEAFKAILRRETIKRLKASGELVKADIVRSLSVPCAGSELRGIEARHSLPGEPPRAETGNLKRNIYSIVEDELDGPTVYIGTPVEYGAYLELGTSKMDPRPWLRPALNRMLPRVQYMLQQPIPH